MFLLACFLWSARDSAFLQNNAPHPKCIGFTLTGLTERSSPCLSPVHACLVSVCLFAFLLLFFLTKVGEDKNLSHYFIFIIKNKNKYTNYKYT